MAQGVVARLRRHRAVVRSRQCRLARDRSNLPPVQRGIFLSTPPAVHLREGDRWCQTRFGTVRTFVSSLACPARSSDNVGCGEWIDAPCRHRHYRLGLVSRQDPVCHARTRDSCSTQSNLISLVEMRCRLVPISNRVRSASIDHAQVKFPRVAH